MELIKTIKEKVFIIGEIGNNHNGNLETAKKLIDIAADAGVDAVKFQTFKGLDIVAPTVLANSYKGWDPKGFTYWYEFLDTIALSYNDHKLAFAYANEKGVIPFSTPTSPKSVEFLESIDNPIYKIASMDVTNIPLLKAVAKTGKPTIISTGMANEEEISEAIKILNKNELVVLHCVSDYPTKPENANLKNMNFLAERFNVPVGLSDHSISNEFALASIALGGRVIEKHITYDRNASEKAEHHFALMPNELKSLVAQIRNLEKGLSTKQLNRSNSELENRSNFRRGLHLNKALKQGDVIAEHDLSVVRPCLGEGPEKYDAFLGKKLAKDKLPWTGLTFKDIGQ